MNDDAAAFGNVFKADPEKALERLSKKSHELLTQAGESGTEGRARRTRRSSAAPADAQAPRSSAPRQLGSAPAQIAQTEPAPASAPVVAEPAVTRGSTPTPAQRSTTQAQKGRRTSATVPEDVWKAVGHYCLNESVSRSGLIMRALAKTQGRHKELVEKERRRESTSTEDLGVMEMFGLDAAPVRRGGAPPKKQLPYVVTAKVAAAIDDLVIKAGAHNRGELFTAVLRDYLELADD